MIKSIKNKTKTKIKIKTKKNKNDVLDIISNLNNLLLKVKIYHWTSDYFSIHKVTDKFLKTLSSLLDKFVEVYLGSTLENNNIVERNLKNKLKNIRIKPISKKNELIKDLNKNIKYLKLHDSSIELNAIRDEIVSELQKFKYLLNLN